MKKLFTKYTQWCEYRATVDTLSHLSNRELKDIGLTRGDIGRVARSVYQ